MTLPIALEERVRALEVQVTRLTWFVDNLYRATGTEWPGEPPPEDALRDSVLNDLVRRGAMMDAIQRYRTLTGATLAEAKAAIQALRA